MLYETTITFAGTTDKKETATIKEILIVEGCGWFAEVEAKVAEQYKDYPNFDVVAIKRSRIKEIANTRQSDEDKIFTATLVDVFLKDDGTEKETKYAIAFFSRNIDTAHAFVQEYTSQGYNMGITQIKETRFIDVIK